MIIQNGYIECIANKLTERINPKTGFPVKAENLEWCEPIPCQWSPIKMNLRNQVKGEHHTDITYQILIEQQPFPYEQIRLQDISGKSLGQYSIISIEELDAVCEIKIIV